MRSLLALLAVLPLGQPTPSPSPTAAPDAGALYERSLDKAIERAQRALVRRTEVWQDHSTWARAWRVRTDHYEVVTTRSRYFGMEVAQGLEAVLGHFQTEYGTRFVFTPRGGV